jgi:hypothetical protein
MAFGFQNCCDIEDYFYVNGIPGSVSEYEIYYIETTQGETLCGTYVELPELFYQPITYDLIGMTAQTSCNSCISLNPCPTGILIDFGQQHSGIFTTVNECNIKTIFPFYVECDTVFPTLDGSVEGSVSLFVTGGTPPYSFYSAGTETQIGQGIEPVNNTYLLYNGINDGIYSTTVVDYYGDNVQTVDCVIPQLPHYLSADCLITNPTISGYDDGTLSLYVAGGTPPYTYYYLGNEITLPLFNLTAGTYNITVIDSGIGIYSQTVTTSCLLQNPTQIVYPNKLCMNFDYCGVEFYLNFTSASTYNLRPLYTLSNPSEISVTGMTLYWDNSWLTSVENHNAPLAIPTQCQQAQTCSFTIQNPYAIKPQDSGWNGSGTFSSGPSISSIIVTSGVCSAITPTLSVQVTNYCNNTTQCQGHATLVANSSFGGPYTYFVDGVQQNSPVFNTLCAGGHTAQVIDGDGNLSDITSFNISTTTPSIIAKSNCVYTNFNNNTLNNFYNGGNLNWNFKSTLSNIPIGCNLTVKVQLVYQYAAYGEPVNSSIITPVLPSTGTWTLFSQTSTPVNSSCGTYNENVKVFSTTLTTNSTSYQILLPDCGFNWQFNSTSVTNLSCPPKVYGKITVAVTSIFFNGNNCCITPPSAYVIGYSSVEVTKKKGLLPSDIVWSPQDTSCNPGSPSPIGGPAQ